MVTKRRTSLVVLAALPLVCAGCFFVSSGRQPGPVITVEVSYPEAGSQEINDTIAIPIEQQVIGVEKMLQMRSRCLLDGTYTLEVTFESGTNLNLARVLTQNRVNLTAPILPDVVKRLGVRVREKSPVMLVLITVSSPEGNRNPLDLGDYVDTQLKDKLSRLPGVDTVALFGRTEYSLRVLIDLRKLALFGLKSSDVARAIEGRSKLATAGEPEKPRVDAAKEGRTRSITRGQIPDTGTLLELELKTPTEGQTVELRNVALVQLERTRQSDAKLDGIPVVAVGVYPAPGALAGQLSAAIHDLLAQLRPGLPKGIRLDLGIDFTPNLEAPDLPTTPRYMLLDLYLPADILPELTTDILKRSEAILRGVAGVQQVLVLSERLFDFPRDRPCILLRLTPAGRSQTSQDELGKTIRSLLKGGVPEIAFQLRNLSGSGRFPSLGFPIDLAVSGPSQSRYDSLLSLAEKLTSRLAECPALADLMISRAYTPKDDLFVEIDDTVKAKDVSLDDVLGALQALCGNGSIGSFLITADSASDHGYQFKRDHGPWRIMRRQIDRVQPERFRDELKNTSVPSSRGLMVPLINVVKLRPRSGPDILERLDGRPMVEITANLAPGASPAQAHKLCERLARGVTLPAGYEITWLH